MIRRPLIYLMFVGCLALATSGNSQVPLQAFPAVELRIPTVPGKTYFLEQSTELDKWSPLGSWITGDGTVLRTFAPADAKAGFYRATAGDVRDLNTLLEPILATHAVPALGCAVIAGNRLAGLGSVGVRKWNVPGSAVKPGDLWHHGSVTKSMTATLAAMMVERGEIRWDSTLAEIFPDLAPSMNGQWRTVTLELLTTNRSGAPTDLTPSGIWGQVQSFGGMPIEARHLLMEKLTALPPGSPPGTKYEYSGAGFSMAGHMLETVAGKPWEELIRTRLFVPLGMMTAGFGVPATPRHIDQPWGHQLAGTVITPLESSVGADNPTAMSPAGSVHCSLEDIARYAAFHVAGHHADHPLLSKNSFVKLHTAIPDNSNYAHGWTVSDRPWGGPEQVLNHNGSNTLWYTNFSFAPGRGFAVIVTCNIAGSPTNRGANATSQVVAKMIQEFLD